ncbi:hypothetical protein AUP68_04146 [Ilyonectria robusta]
MVRTSLGVRFTVIGIAAWIAHMLLKRRLRHETSVVTFAVTHYDEQKQLYAEVLENTQFALIATVYKLYLMVRKNQLWELDEPELNDRGVPVIHNIAQKLGCIRPNSNIDLPIHSVFPKDEAGMAELARQLEEQQREQEPQKEAKKADSSIYNRTERALSSKLDHSDFEHGYRKLSFESNNALTLSPQSFTSSNNFEFAPLPSDIDATARFPSQSPSIPNFPAWAISKPQTNDPTIQFLQQTSIV